MSIEVEKLVEPLVDLGTLLVIDKDPIEDIDDADIEDRDENLNELARNNTQLLFNKIWELPRKNIGHFICAELPNSTYPLPREKPIPTPREPTKWEKFAREKGIVKQKQDRKVWDEAENEWKPRYGYRRANDTSKDWLIEIPDQKDPYTDYFEERKQEKKERVNKNEFQRLRNIARSMKTAGGTNSNYIPLGDKGSKTFEKRQANNAKNEIPNKMFHAKNATASMGKFQNPIKGEKKANIGEKRKFEANESNIANERKHQLELFSSLQSKKPKLAESKFNAVREQSARNDRKNSSDKVVEVNKARRSASGNRHTSKNNVKRQQHFKTNKKPGFKSSNSKAGKAQMRKA